ncbi:MAG: hypothetical protein HOO86_08670 [Bacteroidales bacterium]|nr:hypothetical protein [Bacteroidales bacterium]
MKKLLLIAFLSITCLTQAQELPTIPANGFAFPIGTKFTIKLIEVDSINFDYSVIAFEQFDKTVDTYSHDDLFDKIGNDSTITFYFCLGTHGETEAEKKKNTQVLLLMKNYTKFALKYSSDIQREQDGKFEFTSNIGIFPGAMGMEMWPYMIYTIGLNRFEKYR